MSFWGVQYRLGTDLASQLMPVQIRIESVIVNVTDSHWDPYFHLAWKLSHSKYLHWPPSYILIHACEWISPQGTWVKHFYCWIEPQNHKSEDIFNFVNFLYLWPYALLFPLWLPSSVNRYSLSPVPGHTLQLPQWVSNPGLKLYLHDLITF